MIYIVASWIIGHLFGVNLSIIYAIFTVIFILFSNSNKFSFQARFYLFLLLCLTLRGYYHGNDLILISTDLLKFLLFGYVAFSLKITEKSFLLLCKWMLRIGITAFIVTFVLYTFSFTAGRNVFVEEVYEPAKYISGSLLLVTLGMPLLTRQVVRLAYICLICTLLWGLLSDTRAFVIFPFLVFLLRFYVRSKLLMLVFSLTVSIPLFILFTSGLDLGRYSGSVLNGRDLEALYYLADCSRGELVFGRGFGGVNKTWIWQDTKGGSSMMHLGLMYMLMKGGVLLVVTYLFWFVSKILFSKENYGLVFFIFFVQDFFTSQWLFLPGVLILGLIINIYHVKERRHVGT